MTRDGTQEIIVLFQSSPDHAIRVRRAGQQCGEQRLHGFQSSPDHAIGCDHAEMVLGTSSKFIRFQSSPDHARPGCNLSQIDGTCDRRVFQSSPDHVRSGATLTVSTAVRALVQRFNPHPTTRSGATWDASKVPESHLRFQSSPDHAIGCDLIQGPSDVTLTRESCFNPHPTTRSGATWYVPSTAL